MYSQAGVTSDNCSIDEGGYCKIGNLVVVNVRLTTTASVSNNATILSGLPKPTGSINHVPISSSVLDAGGYMSQTGTSGEIKFTTKSTVASNTIIMISATYITD